MSTLYVSYQFFFLFFFFFFQAEDGIRDLTVTGVQTCALPIWTRDGAPIPVRRDQPRPHRRGGPDPRQRQPPRLVHGGDGGVSLDWPDRPAHVHVVAGRVPRGPPPDRRGDDVRPANLPVPVRPCPAGVRRREVGRRGDRPDPPGVGLERRR